ncbi:MAG: hypothetical protein AABZ30_01835 [Myxococcota bacterium]
MRTALALTLAASTSAAAAEPIAPIDLAFNEILAPEMRKSLVSELAEALGAHGYELQGPRATAARLRDARLPPRCVIGPCLAKVGKILGTRLVLVGAVEGEGTTFDLSVTVLETREGRAVAQAAERCDVCTFAEVQSAMRRLAQKLAGELAAAMPPVSPRASEAEAGGAATTSSGPIWPGWKWIALGAGVVAVGVGGYVFSLDGDCATTACDERYTTGGAGMVLLGAGSAALGGAGLMLLFGY